MWGPGWYGFSLPTQRMALPVSTSTSLNVWLLPHWTTRGKLGLIYTSLALIGVIELLLTSCYDFDDGIFKTILKGIPLYGGYLYYRVLKKGKDSLLVKSDPAGKLKSTRCLINGKRVSSLNVLHSGPDWHFQQLVPIDRPGRDKQPKDDSKYHDSRRKKASTKKNKRTIRLQKVASRRNSKPTLLRYRLPLGYHVTKSWLRQRLSGL